MLETKGKKCTMLIELKVHPERYWSCGSRHALPALPAMINRFYRLFMGFPEVFFIRLITAKPGLDSASVVDRPC